MVKQGPLHRFAHEAMATTFEIVVAGEEERYACQAAQAAFGEIDRLEGLLSRFDPCSDVAQINRLEPGEWVCVSVDVYRCLKIAMQVYNETKGAFDVTVGPLMQCWRDEAGKTREPTPADLAAARARIGMERLILDESGGEDDKTAEPLLPEDDFEDTGRTRSEGPRNFRVGVRPESEGASALGVEVDLGGIGKGFALERIAEILDDWDVSSALVHGGTSTALAIGSTGEGTGWPVGVGGEWGRAVGLERILLREGALSGSGMEVKGRHVFDPRSGRPAESHLAAWVCCPSAAVADALSTAFLVMSTDAVEAFCASRPDVSALVVAPGPEGPMARIFGSYFRESLEDHISRIP